MADKKKTGRCFLVGAGPGDLGLVTLRAKEFIEQADVIVYDYLCNPEMLQWAPETARDHLRREKGGRAYADAGGNQCAAGRKDAVREASRSAERRRSVCVRARRGGGAGAGRGIALPFEVVPGITSAIAAPAYAGIPVTHRGMTSHVTFFTGHEDPEKTESSIDFAALAKLGGTQVMLMGVERIEAIAQQMLAARRAAGFAGGADSLGDDRPAGNVRGTLENIAQRVAEQNFAAAGGGGFRRSGVVRRRS